MASVQLRAIGKRYAGGVEPLRNFELGVADGEFMVLVGPSGCGKSTALRIVAGLEAPSSGSVLIGGEDVTAWAPRERDVAMVFQSYALYPHKTVRENLGFGLRMRGVASAEREQRTRQVADKLGLSALLDRRPAQLSGGQRQRVALGRALCRNPRVFLLDEPLSNLDAKLRTEMRVELARLHAAFGVTTLYVTHDQEEAMTLGERIAVLSAGGRIEQLGTPSQIYDQPASVFVAEFVGTPTINWFRGELDTHDPGCFRCRDFAVRVPGAMRPGGAVGGELLLGIRPHDLALGPSDASPMRARVELVELLGAACLVHAQTDANPDVRVWVSAETRVRRGDLIGLSPAAARLHAFDPRTGLRLG